jgi:3-hydroxyacyl-[acyl-carrier-protein] dehydratase
MLKYSLYKILSKEQQEKNIHATLEINKNDAIFEGHFPGQPVLPGACMLQILKEVLESSLSVSLRMKKADQIKFPSPVDPSRNNILKLSLSYKENDDSMDVNASFTCGENTCLKFKGSFANTEMNHAG